MIEWINNNYIEIIGAILAFIYLILEIKQNWTFWIACIISSAFYVYIFFRAALYAEMSLNGYYIIMALYGLYSWKFATKITGKNSDFHHLSTRTAVLLSLVCVLTSGCVYFILVSFTDSQVPVSDTLIASLSIIATWMVAKKIVECWFVWIIVDTFATGLYVYQKLYPTAVLFTCYSILSVVGWVQWRKSVKKNDTAFAKL